MNAILHLPIGLRLAVLCVLGALGGGLINWACYSLAWNKRICSPWSPGPRKAPPRTWLDRLPIFGWLRMRRESKFHGAGFWIRPALIEVLTGAFFAALYWWEADQGALLPAQGIVAALPLVVHVSYFAHVVLLSLLAVATLIDIDEKTIPDGVTTPGTLAGLLFAAAYPWSLLPAVAWTPAPGVVALDVLWLTAPGPWPEVLSGWPGLWLAWACWWSWCLAILPLRWFGRHGWWRGLQMIIARTLRHPYTWAGILGTVMIAALWQWAAAPHWAGLLTALVGMAAGGGMIWMVRIIGAAVLGREAMGFGDVTLMAMIGAFVGWQSCLMIFFLAPFAGAVIAVTLWIFHRSREIAYGPFLCLATLILIAFWQPIWSHAEPIFSLGWLVPAAMGVCLLLLGVLLAVWVWIRTRLRWLQVSRRRRRRGPPGD